MKRLIATLTKNTYYSKLISFQSKTFFWRNKEPVNNTEKQIKKEEKNTEEIDENLLQQIENTQENFKEYLQFMIKIDIFTWEQYYRMLLEKYKANNSYANKIRGVKEDKGSLDACNKVKSCLRKHEQNKIKFSESERKVISNLTSITEDNLNSIISNFIQVRLSHNTIHQRIKANLPLPRSFTELQKLSGNYECAELSALQDEYLETTLAKTGMTKEQIQDKQAEIFRHHAKNLKRTRALY